MNGEYTVHKKALEEGGWLKSGKVVHYWIGDGGSYPVSFYVVAFKDYNTGKITIDCIRVFGGTDKVPANVSIDKRVKDWTQIFGENK